MDHGDAVKLKILDAAEHGATFRELLGRHVWYEPRRWYQRSRERELYPKTERELTRQVLIELLQDGLVELYEVTGESIASAEAALAAIDVDANWEMAGPAGYAVLYEVVLTEAGEAAYYKVRDRVAAASRGGFAN